MCPITKNNEHNYVLTMCTTTEDHYTCTECGDYMIQYVDGCRG